MALVKAQPDYTREHITAALARLAYNNGNAKRTHEELKQAGWEHTPGMQTIANWRRRNPELYEEALSRVDEQVMPEIDALTRDLIRFQQQGVKRMLDNVDEFEVRDLSSAVRNASISMGIAVEKSQLLKGQPTSRTEIVDPAALIREMEALRLKALNAAGAIDSTAVEITQEEDDG